MAEFQTQSTSLSDDLSFMHDRLRRARLLAGFDTARAAIERFGWKASTYRAHENGQNKFRASDAGAYARAYKTSSAWLLFGEQGPNPPPVGSAGGELTHKIPPREDHFDLNLDSDELTDIACRGDILRFAPVFDHRALSDGDIVAVERRTESGVDILPKRVFFRHGKTMFAPAPTAPAETFIESRILGKAIWLLRRLAL